MTLDYTDISSCTIEYDEEYSWYIDDEGIIHNDEIDEFIQAPISIPLPDGYWRYNSGTDNPTHNVLDVFTQQAIDTPLPKSYWRISQGINSGYPYHELLDDIISIFFIWELTADSLITIPNS